MRLLNHDEILIWLGGQSQVVTLATIRKPDMAAQPSSLNLICQLYRILIDKPARYLLRSRFGRSSEGDDIPKLRDLAEVTYGH